MATIEKLNLEKQTIQKKAELLNKVVEEKIQEKLQLEQKNSGILHSISQQRLLENKTNERILQLKLKEKHMKDMSQKVVFGGMYGILATWLLGMTIALFWTALERLSMKYGFWSADSHLLSTPFNTSIHQQVTIIARRFHFFSLLPLFPGVAIGMGFGYGFSRSRQNQNSDNKTDQSYPNQVEFCQDGQIYKYKKSIPKAKPALHIRIIGKMGSILPSWLTQLLLRACTFFDFLWKLYKGEFGSNILELVGFSTKEHYQSFMNEQWQDDIFENESNPLYSIMDELLGY